MINRNCPNCNSNSYSSVTRSPRDPDAIDVSALGELFVGLRPEQIFFEYVRCRVCELVYCPRYFTKGDLDNLYSHMPPNLVGDDLDVVDKTHEGYARHIIKKVRKSGNAVYDGPLLELGADLGLVTGPVVAALKMKNGVLVEPNLDVRNELFKSVKNDAGFMIIDDFMEFDTSTISPFGLVIAVHVLDHLMNPKEELSLIYNSMREGGRIFIVVHNQKSILARIMGSKWPPYCLQHPQLFDPKSLTSMLSSLGFHSFKVSRTTNYAGLRNGAQTLLKVLGLPNRFLSFLPNLPIPIKYGNVMIEAEK